jgi:hypothetical protein
MSMTRKMARWILGLMLCWPVACTKTERPIDINASTNSASGPLTALEPRTPAGAPGTVVPVNSCNIEVLNDLAPTEKPLALRLNDGLRVEGWVVDASNPKSPPEQVFILLRAVVSGSSWYGRISKRVPRADVVKVMGSALLSGFRAGLDLAQVPRGEYLVLVAFWQEGPLQVCDVGRRVLIE